MASFESYRKYCVEDGVNPDEWDDYGCKAYCCCREAFGWDQDDAKAAIDTQSYYLYSCLEDYGIQLVADQFEDIAPPFADVLRRHIDYENLAQEFIDSGIPRIEHFDGHYIEIIY